MSDGSAVDRLTLVCINMLKTNFVLHVVCVCYICEVWIQSYEGGFYSSA